MLGLGDHVLVFVCTTFHLVFSACFSVLFICIFINGFGVWDFRDALFAPRLRWDAA